MEARSGDYGHPATMQYLNSEIMTIKKLIQEATSIREDRKEKSIEWKTQEPSQRELVKGIDEVSICFLVVSIVCLITVFLYYCSLRKGHVDEC